MPIWVDPSWYDLVWDVGVLQEIIQVERCNPHRFKVPQLYSDHLRTKKIEESRLPVAQDKEDPIILIEFLMIPEHYLLIDGSQSVPSRSE